MKCNKIIGVAIIAMMCMTACGKASVDSVSGNGTIAAEDQLNEEQTNLNSDMESASSDSISDNAIPATTETIDALYDSYNDLVEVFNTVNTAYQADDIAKNEEVETKLQYYYSEIQEMGKTDFETVTAKQALEMETQIVEYKSDIKEIENLFEKIEEE